MEKIIPLKTNERKFYRQLLELLNPMLRLRKKELDVMAELLIKNDALKDVPKEHRMKLILDSASRKEMREKIKQTEASFNNNLSKLKKYKYITDEGIKKELDITFEIPSRLIFEFIL